jgi:hypothetical protein
MATCNVYKGAQLLGTGSIAAAGTTITSWTVRNDGLAGDVDHKVLRRNLQVAITSSTHAGSSFYTRVIADNGAGTLTLKDACPFAT